MLKVRNKKAEKGFSLVELLIIAAFIGVLIAIAIPNVRKARISSNEANAIKAMQALRDAEALYYKQDMDEDGLREYTAQIGNLGTPETLRCPLIGGGCTDQDSLIDDSFEGAVASDTTSECADSKAGYCIQFAGDIDGGDPSVLENEFGWETSMTSAGRTGIRDFAIYEDGLIRCIDSRRAKGEAGRFQANRKSPPCN